MAAAISFLFFHAAILYRGVRPGYLEYSIALFTGSMQDKPLSRLQRYLPGPTSDVLAFWGRERIDEINGDTALLVPEISSRDFWTARYKGASLGQCVALGRTHMLKELGAPENFFQRTLMWPIASLVVIVNAYALARQDNARSSAGTLWLDGLANHRGVGIYSSEATRALVRRRKGEGDPGDEELIGKDFLARARTSRRSSWNVLCALWIQIVHKNHLTPVIDVLFFLAHGWALAMLITLGAIWSLKHYSAHGGAYAWLGPLLNVAFAVKAGYWAESSRREYIDHARVGPLVRMTWLVWLSFSAGLFVPGNFSWVTLCIDILIALIAAGVSTVAIRMRLSEAR